MNVIKTIDELNAVKAAAAEVVATRVEGKDNGVKDVLVCGGTGCTSSGSMKIIEKLQEELKKNGLEGKVWQYFTVVPDFKSVGVKNDARTFAYPVIIRAVNTRDAMTATVENVPFELLEHITNRITTEIDGVNRVLYDLTPKPCATIEWE